MEEWRIRKDGMMKMADNNISNTINNITNNDDRIMLLKKKIADKKKELGKAIKFNPESNCLLELDGVKYNLNVVDKNTLTLIILKLESYI